jgi:3-oxoacyl-[acyl-carrier protein] reductase
MQFGLEKKRVLITGASRGIGRAAATGFAAEGADLCLVARDAAMLARAQLELHQQHGATVEVLALDMRAPDAIASITERFGDADILINNAGDIPHGNLQAIDAARWRQAWDLKVFGYIDLSRAVYERMRARRAGVIVNVIGMAGGDSIVPDYIAGTAGNAALHAFTRALGTASPADGIRVVGLHPGAIATDRQIVRWRQRALDGLGDAERWRELTTGLPFGRLAEPVEIANALVFLASSAASYIYGATLTVDGGLSQRPGR